MSNKIDLDAARAARRETSGTGPTATLGGEEFVFPVEVPFAAAQILGDVATAQEAGDVAKVMGAVVSFLEALLGPEDYARFREHRPSLQDLMSLIEGLSKAYGFGDPGESPASPSS